MNQNFSTLASIIKNRRSIKPALFNGEKIEDDTVEQLLQLADWAPTHTFSEPWRFVVYSGDALTNFSRDHAELYKANTPGEKFTQAKYDSIIANGEKASHLLVCIMKRSNDKIPVMEELASVACAVQNILLGAETLAVAALWSTGGMALHPSMKDYFHLQQEDQVMGLLYLGKTNETVEGKRKIPLAEKIQWRK